MLPWVFFVVGYAQGSAQIGGEVKRASRSQYFAMVGGVLINGAVLPSSCGPTCTRSAITGPPACPS